MGKYPPLTVFNEADEPIGEAMLEGILEKGLWHRVIHVIVEDKDGNVLLQMRGPNVKTDPNTWDFAVGGYVDAGEDYKQAAIRELKEELGIEGFELEDIGVKAESLNVDSYRINRFAGEFKVVIPRDYNLTIEPEEVAAIKWYMPADLKKLINSDQKALTPYFKNWLTEYYFSHENN